MAWLAVISATAVVVLVVWGIIKLLDGEDSDG